MPIRNASRSLATRLARTTRTTQVCVCTGVRAARRRACGLKTQVRELLVPSNTDPWPEVRDDLNRTLRGWSSYVNLGSPVAAFRSVDHYVRERVRGFLARRHKVAGRGNRRFTYDEVHR